MKKKRCTKCGELKPLDGFYNHARRWDGKDSVCKPCKNQIKYSYKEKVSYTNSNRIPSIECDYHCITCGMGHDTEREAALCCDYKAKL